MRQHRTVVLRAEFLPQVSGRTPAFSHVKPSNQCDDQNHRGGKHNYFRVQQIWIHRKTSVMLGTTEQNVACEALSARRTVVAQQVKAVAPVPMFAPTPKNPSGG